MNPTLFDQISRRFSEQRASRRTAVTASLAAGALAATGGRVHAQDATPMTSPDVETVVLPHSEDTPTQLFVQAFQSGTIAPSTSEFGTHTVTLAQGLGQTIVFTDRPSREVFTTPTPAFLDGLDFGADNPPNAAILMDAGDGTTDIAVIELFNPTYDEATHTATYDISVLANWQNDLELGFQEEPADLANVPADFGATHLFIDGCRDPFVYCFGPDYPNHWVHRGTFENAGKEYWASEWTCLPWAPDAQSVEDILHYWHARCNETFPECEGKCDKIYY